MIAPVVIVKAPVVSSRSIRLESEPAVKPEVIVSYDGIFTNKNHIKFHIMIINNDQVYDVYALGTDKLGKWEARWYNEHPEIKFLNKNMTLDGYEVTTEMLR